MIRFKSVSLMRGTKPLLEQADLTLNPGDRIGLIGPNGTGKTSLFAMLRNELHPDLGDIEVPAHWRMAHVAQETPALDRSALDYAIDGDSQVRLLQAELAQLESDPNASGTRIAEIHTALADAGSYTIASRAEQLLTGLGFTQAQMQHPVASFSGGWRMRLNLAQALMCPSDLLLLDEPTNHLDLDAILWLEDWLRRYAGTLLIISHDRDFLDGIVNVIVHIDDKKLRRYTGNYSSFERQRAAQLELQQGMIEKQTRQRAHLQSFIDRFKAQATKARQAQSRMKALARMEEIAPLRAAAEFSFTFREPASAPNPLLLLDDVAAGYRMTDQASGNETDKIIVNGIKLSLQNGQRIGLLGMNGAGKSTLIKTIAGEIAALSGKTQFGKGLVIGYFAQHQLEMLRHDESPLWHMMKIAPDVREQELRNFLGSFNFNGEMASSAIAPFSGGEKARLALALIVWQRPNLLLLDEPTNHLDLETREALTDALAQFEGTVVLVSHDRHLLRATTDEFIIVSEGRLQPFDGDLDDYRDWLFRTRLADKQKADAPSQDPAENARPATDRREQKKLEAEQRQRLSALKKPLETTIRKMETQMAPLQERKNAIETTLADPVIYESDNKEQLKSLLAEQLDVNRVLEELEMQWLQAQEELEVLLSSAGG